MAALLAPPFRFCDLATHALPLLAAGVILESVHAFGVRSCRRASPAATWAWQGTPCPYLQQALSLRVFTPSVCAVVAGQALQLRGPGKEKRLRRVRHPLPVPLA